MTLREAAALSALLALAPAVAPAEPVDCVIEPRSTVRIGSAEEGLLAELRVERGDIVQKGQVIAVLDSELQRLAAEAARLRASSEINTLSNEARLRFQEIQSGRVQGLASKKIASEQRVDEVEVEHELARLAVEASRLDNEIAQVEAANAEARLQRRFIRSPASGVVVATEMSEGEHVHEQAVILTIADIATLHVEAFVPIEYYRDIAVGDMTEVVVPPPLDFRRDAQVTVIDQVFDAASGSFGVRLEIDNRSHSMPAGLRCQLQFAGAAGEVGAVGK